MEKMGALGFHNDARAAAICSSYIFGICLICKRIKTNRTDFFTQISNVAYTYELYTLKFEEKAIV